MRHKTDLINLFCLSPKRMYVLLYRGIFAILPFLFFLTPAISQDQSSTVTLVFEDWHVVCRNDQLDTNGSCRLAPRAEGIEGASDAFALSITHSSTNERAYGVVSVPLGIYLSHGILIQVDGQRPYQVLYEVCDRTACFAGFEISGAILSAFQRGLQTQFRIWTGRTQAIEVTVSLKGFSAAWAEFNARV